MRLASAPGRWVVAASVLGSGAVFLEGTVVNVALPAMARDFGFGIAGLQWVMNGYLLTLSALMLLGGALGDRYRRSTVFVVGCVAFAVTSAGCALAPDLVSLVALRLVQGAAGALLVPNSLAMIETAFSGVDRGAAIGQWSAWSAVSTAAGPLMGGWVVDATLWRWVFAGVVIFALAAAWIVVHHSPAFDASPVATTDPMARPVRAGDTARSRIDYLGAALVTAGLAGVVGALIAGPDLGFGSAVVLAGGIGGIMLLTAFAVDERRIAHRGGLPLLPTSVFRSRQFTGANLVTVLVYAALTGLFLLLMPQLQLNLGYSALAAGAALLPTNVLLLGLSPWAGRLSVRIGPRLPIAVGALLTAVGMLLFTRVQPGTSYLTTVFPGAVVCGLGLSAFVAPLTSAVLGALDESEAGVASGINNAAARLAGLLAGAVLPLAAGLGGVRQLNGATFAAGYSRAMAISAAFCVAGAAVALITIPKRRATAGEFNRVAPDPV